MHKDLQEIIEKAKRLSDLDKLALIEELEVQLDRPDPEIERVWADEAEKRLKMYREGKLKTVSFEEIMGKYRL